MASSGNAKNYGKQVGEEDEEETLSELEGFDDFTVASSWERFISDIEAVCRLWMVDGPKNLMEKGVEYISYLKDLCKIKCELKYRSKCYCMEYYFQINENIVAWNDDLHNLQLIFGVKEFLVIAPVSASGVVLDTPEASKLLSSVAVALSNCGSIWPAFVPVHDPSRKAYFGIQNMGTIFTRRFDADRIGSQVPIRLMHLEGVYELFVSKFAFSITDFSTTIFNVKFSMKLTYRTPPYDDDDEYDIQAVVPEVGESAVKTVGDTYIKTVWDDECPWSEWYSAEDPIEGFELIAIWSSNTVRNSLEMAELENASVLEAKKWLLCPLLLSNVDDSIEHMIGFASQLRLLINAFDISYKAKFIEDLVSDETPGSDNLKPSNAVPPPSVLDRVLKDLFHDGIQIPDVKWEHNNACAIKGAPFGSLFAQFCLHALWFGNCNVHAIAALWIEFVREVRWCWEESQRLPRTMTGGGIDLSSCLIHQKVQMLAVCIEKRGVKHDDDNKNNFHEVDQIEGNLSLTETTNDSNHESEQDLRKSTDNLENTVASADPQLSSQVRRGSSGFAGNMMLLHSHQKMHAPYTQDVPIMTEDMHEERLQAAEAFGDKFSFSAHLEREMLCSDMSSFKAANPEAVFEDFIRWHSPGDWENVENEGNNISLGAKGVYHDWPPRGRLSQRMSEHGNSWRQIWNESPPLPASEQKPLLDPIREGEKILHYLETLRPHLLLEQMVCTAFKASIDTLSQTSYGDLKQMKTKVGQLYLTVASGLKPLRGNNVADRAELIGDLMRLCTVLEHVEKLVIFAASIHHKLVDTPRLYQALFSDYYSFYLPKMGTGSSNISYDKMFKTKQLVLLHERDTVVTLFPQPTANQSWRKVLSMGNLLNGHEPILREIIFSAYDGATGATGGQYGSSAPGSSTEDIETHRMYICGTSNDLQVALSVTSWD
uniref:Rab3 GTPase-activating protein catalytic subunit n=1 Tax=Anthurium amnicola TaxID=1678845 RepID=A0A1D1YA05_9ARAE